MHLGSLESTQEARVIKLQCNLDLTKSLGPAKFVSQIEGSLYRGSFSYILLLLGQRIPFVISRFSLNRGSLNRGATVLCLFCALQIS